MPTPNGHNDISKNELPHGGIGSNGGINTQSKVSIYELAKTFDDGYAPKTEADNVSVTSNKASFAGSTFNTDSTGIDDPTELFNGGKGKEGNKYDD